MCGGGGVCVVVVCVCARECVCTCVCSLCGMVYCHISHYTGILRGATVREK